MLVSSAVTRSHPAGSEKTDAAEHLRVLGRVGLLVNGTPGRAGLPFI
jgi:hypothetical protein